MEAVRALLARYCDLMDAGDWDGVGELFRNGVLRSPEGIELARGSLSVADFYRTGTQLHGGSPRTKHLVLNTVIESAGESAATARSSYVVLQALDGFPLQPIITGRYVDRFVERDGLWTIAERTFFVDLAGDLSRHLTYRPGDTPGPPGEI